MLQSSYPQGHDIDNIDTFYYINRYAADVIASTFFGLNINTFKDTNNSFHNLRYKLNQNTFFRTLASSANFLCPKLVENKERESWEAAMRR